MEKSSSLRKIQLEMKSWKSLVRLPLPCDNVKGIKVRWLTYETADVGCKVLHLNCPNFTHSGYALSDDGSTDDYFYSIPLDPNKDVTCLTSDFTGAYDIVFDNPIQSINQFTIEANINGSPAITLVTPTNPIVFELGFYS